MADTLSFLLSSAHITNVFPPHTMVTSRHVHTAQVHYGYGYLVGRALLLQLFAKLMSIDVGEGANVIIFVFDVVVYFYFFLFAGSGIFQFILYTSDRTIWTLFTWSKLSRDYSFYSTDVFD